MTQLSLIADTKIARDRDPVTSKLAAEQITASGERARQQNQCLGAVKQWPGRTSAELARCMGTDRFMPARRLSELREQGLIENGLPVRCTVTGKQSLTWWIAGTVPNFPEAA